MRSRFHDRARHDDRSRRDDRSAQDRGEFGFGRHGGPPHRGPRRTRRGDIRVALLSGLDEAPAHGYELIQRLSDRTGGRWKPSPGSVYPTLQLLEDAGFVSASQQDAKRVYAITDAGRAELQAKMAAAGGSPPWMNSESTGSHDDLRKAVAQLMIAAKQVGMADNQAHIDATVGILNESRRKLYQLLAEA
ncbi:MAG: PadR family transcriptional regulator [Actinobacteria bacterium]|nr:PadR family transcriptional regulator [Actinomycetota bacterium]